MALGLKADLGRERVGAFRAWAQGKFPAVAASTATGEGLDEVKGLIFRGSGVVRVYTKKPGHPLTFRNPTRFEKEQPCSTWWSRYTKIS